MTFTPFDWQRHDLNVLRKNGYVGLLNQGTGSGKTALTTWAIQESAADVSLVVAPEQTHATAWIPTIQELLGKEARTIGGTGKAKKQALADFEMGTPGIYLVTPQMLTRAETANWSGDMIALDESHVLMAPGSKGQRKVSGFSGSDPTPLSRKFEARLSLSGTALRNRFELAWSHGRFLYPDLDDVGDVAEYGFWGWQSRWQQWREIYTNRRDANDRPVKVKQFYGEKDPGKWISMLPCVITHLKRERCCPWHPEGYLPMEKPTEVHETIPLIPEQKKIIRELEDHMMTWLGSHALVTEIPLTQAQRVRQATMAVPTLSEDEDGKILVSFALDAKSPFADRVVDILQSEMAGENCVVYTASQKFAEVLTHRLNCEGISAFEYSGATRKTREADLSEFGGKYRVMVGVLAAASTGIDSMQHVASNEIFVDRDLDETVNEQAYGRLDRIGQRRQVLRIFLNDDLGLSQGRYSAAIAKRLELNKSLRKMS